MKINNLVEQFFAHAVALDQRGGMRNTIYAIDDEIFIVNYDHTLLLRFKLRQSEGRFENPLSFYANDYDSNEFEEKDGKIIFLTDNRNDEYVRRKICGTTGTPPEKIRELFQGYYHYKDENAVEIDFSQNLLTFLEEDLSHVEFTGKEDGAMKIVQRNIYSGAVIEVQKKGGGFFGDDELESDFGPVAIKTSDLWALFAFDQESLRFSFQTNAHHDFIIVESINKAKRDMVGVVACCLYDEVIEIRESKRQDNGGQKPKIRRRIKTPDSTD